MKRSREQKTPTKKSLKRCHYYSSCSFVSPWASRAAPSSAGPGGGGRASTSPECPSAPSAGWTRPWHRPSAAGSCRPPPSGCSLPAASAALAPSAGGAETGTVDISQLRESKVGGEGLLVFRFAEDNLVLSMKYFLNRLPVCQDRNVRYKNLIEMIFLFKWPHTNFKLLK